jgi:quinol-cytochrome oxidoreductase complex cytochrome b subunit
MFITNQVPGGWFVRGVHHWGASAMVLLSVLHMVRVILYGAYKFPREVTWFTGVGLLLATMGFGFTGYLLPWDQKAYWATIVGTRIAGVAPFIGDPILRIMRGGEELSAVTLARFFGAHIWVLPTILLLFLGFHMYLVIRLGISAVPKRDE